MALVNVGHFCFDCTYNAPCIFTALHLDNSSDRFGNPVFDDGALSCFCTHAYRCHIAHEYRGAINFFKHNVADVVEIFDQTNATNEITLFVDWHLAATRVGVVAGKGAVYVLHGQVVMMQTFRVGRYLVFTGITAHCIDFSNTGYAAQHRPDNPVLNDTTFGELFNSERPFTIGRVFNRILIDFTKPC